MSVTMGDAILYLSANPDALTADLKQADGKIKSFGKGAANFLGGALKTGMMAAAAGIAAGIGIVAKSVMEAADAGEAMAKFEATFGSAGERLIVTLDGIASSTGRSKYELRAAAANLGAVTKALGFSEQSAANMSAEVLALSVDLGAFNNLPTEDVAGRIQKALTGEYESLKALGIVINQAKIEQELLNRGFTGGVKSVNDAQKANAIFAIIQGQTGDAVGVAAAEMGSFTGQMVGVKAIFSDFMIDMGTKFLPAITPVITAIGEKLPLAFDWILQKVDKFMGVFEFFKWQLADGKTPIEALIGVFRALVPPELRGKLEEVIATFGKIGDWIAANKDPLMAGLAAIGAVILLSVVPPFVAWAAATLAAMAPIIAIGAIVALLVAAWNSDFLGMKTKLTPVFEKVKAWFQDLLSPVGAVSQAWEKFVGWVKEAIEWLKKLKIPEFLKKGSPSPFEYSLRGIGDALDKVVNPKLGEFAAKLQATGGAGLGAQTTSYDQSRTTRVDQMNINNGRDEQGVMQVLRNASRI